MNSLPYPVRGVKPIAKDSPAGVAAVHEFNAAVGYDIRAAFRDQWWMVAQSGTERPEVLLNAEGLRAMARFAPQPDACEVAEHVIEQARRSR